MNTEYDVLDAFWRLSRWVDEQGPGAKVAWDVDDPPPYPYCDSDPDPDPSPSGPPFLVVVQTDAAGKEKPYGLGGMEEALVPVLQEAHGRYRVTGSFDATTPIQDRAREFAGPAFGQWWRNQELNQSLPQPTRRSAGPRF